MRRSLRTAVPYRIKIKRKRPSSSAEEEAETRLRLDRDECQRMLALRRDARFRASSAAQVSVLLPPVVSVLDVANARLGELLAVRDAKMKMLKLVMDSMNFQAG